MADKTKIEWTDATWNPTTGCTKVSPGCAHCYIDRSPPFRIEGRKFVNGTTDVRLHPDRLEQPLRWTRPRMIFVNSLSDVFHEEIPDEFRDRIFDVMAEASQHTFQVLTKRPKEMLSYLERYCDYDSDFGGGVALLPANIWLGVTIENSRQTWRADYLRAAPAQTRFISAEPLLGSLFEGSGDVWPKTMITDTDGSEITVDTGWPPLENRRPLDLTDIDWLIAGGESGPGFRPLDLDWVRELRDACAGSDTAFFFKQIGGLHAKANGKLIDGREWGELPRDLTAVG